MRILMLTHAFNSLSQRLWLELTEAGHEVSVEFDINDAVTRDAVALCRPDLVLAPLLKRALPADVWRALPCFIVHPGPLGDRGPSALDHAVQTGRAGWGVTVLQAVGRLDAGPVWASRRFAMRAAPKSSLYRREVTEAAVAAVRAALERLSAGKGPLMAANTGTEEEKPPLHQADRAIDWAAMGTGEVLARIRAGDGQPGVRDRLDGHEVWLHDAHPAPGHGGPPGALLGLGREALLRATADGAVWIGHLKVALPDTGRRIKLPAARALQVLGLPAPPAVLCASEPNRPETETLGDVAVIRFPFYNGALSVARAQALAGEIRAAAAGPAKVLLLTGGPEFWSNGIDLATIEAADSPAEASMDAIEAIDDVCLAVLEIEDKWTIAALSGNAGAGGVFMALAADEVIARAGVVLNPHYRNMGNLYGSEYWTYLLPRRLGEDDARALMDTRLPISAPQAARMGLIDATRPGAPGDFETAMIAHAAARAGEATLSGRLAEKSRRRRADAAAKPLSAYRAEELARMRLNFFGFDTSYHMARHDFITQVPKSRTPLYLAGHRRAASAMARP